MLRDRAVDLTAEPRRLRVAPLLEPPGLRLIGAVDLSTRTVLAAALDEAAERAIDLYLALGGLVFIDVGGVTLLVMTAAGLGGGRRLVLLRAPAGLRRIVELLWRSPAMLEVRLP